jgi:hypothetical protein
MIGGISWLLRTIASTFAAKCRAFSAILTTLAVRTHRGRWAETAVAGRPPWDSRNEKIASFIPAGSSVIDLGCGAQTLKRHLSSECEYQPCDLVKSSADVILCDFNAGLYPKVGKRFTHVVCSGVLEYVRNHRRFLKERSSLGENLIVSYNLRLPEDSKLQRMSNNWVNHFSRSELEEIFRDAGLSAECLDVAEDGREAIYKLKTRG